MISFFNICVAASGLAPLGAEPEALDTVSNGDITINYITSVSSGDYNSILHSINDKLTSLESVFHWSFDFTEMGVFYQIMVVIISLMLLKYFIDFLKWRF